jgi:hypothetical protein
MAKSVVVTWNNTFTGRVLSNTLTSDRSVSRMEPHRTRRLERGGSVGLPEVNIIEEFKVAFVFVLCEMSYSLIRLIYKALSKEGSFLINFIINFLNQFNFPFRNVIKQLFLFYLYNAAISRLNCHVIHLRRLPYVLSCYPLPYTRSNLRADMCLKLRGNKFLVLQCLLC